MGFLVRAHGLERVILIAHQDCAFYTEQLGILRSGPGNAAAGRRADRRPATCALAANLRVDVFFARKGPDGTIHFQPIAQ